MTLKFSASEIRILKFLKQSGCEVQDSVRESHCLLVSDAGTIAAARDEIIALHERGVLLLAEQRLVLTTSGRIHGKSQGKSKQSHSQPKARTTQTIDLEHGQKVEVNPAESPLAALYRRKGASGVAFLSEDEFRAGERLRTDFTRGSLMPSITSRWEGSVGGGGSRGAGGVAELTDIALASRQRVERALAAVGPELSGVLIDICCFLKGVERVERERQWPVRSGKMMLKTGLPMLHRHYNPVLERSEIADSILHWGSDDYRPSLRAGEG